MLEGHGDDGYLYQNKIVANFSSNVYYAGFSEEIQTNLINCLARVKNYPEAEGTSLKNLLAIHHQIAAEQIIITNGATEAFYLIAHTFRGESATILIPGFSEYEDACIANGIAINFLEWDKLTTHTRFSSNLVFICNPNNPTGNIISEVFFVELILNNQDVIFVIDEAYIDFTNAVKSSVDLINLFKRIIVVKSLTKTYAIPGLRLGYLTANKDITGRINLVKMPWSVNALALKTGEFILKNIDRLKTPVKKILYETEILSNSLNLLPLIRANPTCTNFILCQTYVATAAELKKFLVEKYGVLIRDASNFRGLTPQHFRVASQSASENELLIEGLKQWIKNF